MKKRKAEEELSKNPHTDKERQRQRQMSSEQREYELRKKADLQSKARAIAKLKNDADFKAMSEHEQSQAEAQAMKLWADERIRTGKHHSLHSFAASRQRTLPMQSSEYMSEDDWDEEDGEDEKQEDIDRAEVSYERLRSKAYGNEVVMRSAGDQGLRRQELEIWTMTRKFWLETEERVRAKGRAMQTGYIHPAKLWVLVPVGPILASVKPLRRAIRPLLKLLRKVFPRLSWQRRFEIAFPGIGGTIDFEKLWSALPPAGQRLLNGIPELKSYPRASVIFTTAEKGWIMNRLAWDTKWQDEFPWTGHIWEDEEDEEWEMDKVSSIEDLKAAYDLVCNASKKVPKSAYRFFTQDSKDAFCKQGLRFALAPKGVRANRIWQAPEGVRCKEEQSYARSLYKFEKSKKA